MDERRHIEIRISISDKRAGEFLDRLADDNDFRNELQERPLTVLLDYGIQVPPEALPEPPLTLPDEAQVRNFIGTLSDYDAPFASASHPLGYAILFMLGAMPIVVERDAS